jgi:hypothetical protein
MILILILILIHRARPGFVRAFRYLPRLVRESPGFINIGRNYRFGFSVMWLLVSEEVPHLDIAAAVMSVADDRAGCVQLTQEAIRVALVETQRPQFDPFRLISQSPTSVGLCGQSKQEPPGEWRQGADLGIVKQIGFDGADT